MRKIETILFLLFIKSFCGALSLATEPNLCIYSPVRDTICCNPDIEPSFVNSDESYDEYIGRQIFEKGKKLSSPVHIIIEFIVEKNGKLSNIKVVYSFGPKNNKWIRDIIKKSGKWNPGMKNRMPVRCKLYFNLYVQPQ